MSTNRKSIISQILDERNQAHFLRKKTIQKLERELQRPIVCLFTSFRFPVILSDDDADMLETILQTMNLEQGLALLLNSPGGSGLAAERIINICRQYIGTNKYWVIVPGKAKSAAIMISFGASKIFMGPASELGPIDPQLSIEEDGRQKRFSLCNIVASYRELFDRAIRETGNLQPYLQQLARYDAREIREFEDAISLSEDIAVRALSSGMMSSYNQNLIKTKINMFLTPEETKAHGRLVDRNTAERCGLKIEKLETDSKIWKLAYELFARLNHFVSTQTAKCLENLNDSYTVQIK